jgi:transposase
LAAAPVENIADVLRNVRAYSHAMRAAELQTSAQQSAGAPMLPHHQWRQAWLIAQLSALERARRELIDQVTLAVGSHPYASIIESLPVKSPIWTATLIGAIGDVSRFRTASEFKAYLGWYPQITRSGTSVDETGLAKNGVRPARNVLGQMTVILLSSTIRPTAFREVYRRLTGRGMRPANALGHVAGKISVVLYGMLRDMTPYDEAKHRRELGLAQPEHASGSVQGVSTDLIDIADSVHEPTEIDIEGLATLKRRPHFGASTHTCALPLLTCH